MRYLQRNVHRSVFDHLVTQVTAMGWVDDPVNFGAEPVTFHEVDLREGVSRIEPTSVAVWVPSESSDRIAELGGVSWTADLDFVIDIYASQASFSIALASDIKDLFRERSIPLLDHGSGSTPVQAGTVELEGAWIDRPTSSALEFNGVWRQVRGFTRVWFEESGA